MSNEEIKEFIEQNTDLKIGKSVANSYELLYMLLQMFRKEINKGCNLQNVSISLPSDKSDDIQIYASYDKSKWAVAGYGLIKEPFDNPHDALKSILAERQ